MLRRKNCLFQCRKTFIKQNFFTYKSLENVENQNLLYSKMTKILEMKKCSSNSEIFEIKTSSLPTGQKS